MQSWSKSCMVVANNSRKCSKAQLKNSAEYRRMSPNFCFLHSFSKVKIFPFLKYFFREIGKSGREGGQEGEKMNGYMQTCIRDLKKMGKSSYSTAERRKKDWLKVQMVHCLGCLRKSWSKAVWGRCCIEVRTIWNVENTEDHHQTLSFCP